MTEQSDGKSGNLLVLSYMAQSHRKLHLFRIGQEFKLVVSVITLFAACAAARLFAKIPTDSVLLSGTVNAFDIIMTATVCFVCFMSFLYLHGSARANKRNQTIEDGRSQKTADRRRTDTEEQEKKTLEKKSHPNKRRWLWQWAAIDAGGLIALLLTWLI